MAHKIAVVQRKGGVGKTLVSGLIAQWLAKQGKKVLLIDTDPQGDAARCVGLEPQDALHRWLVDKAAPETVIYGVSKAVYSTPDEYEQTSGNGGDLWLLPSGPRTFSIPMQETNPFIMRQRVEELDQVFDVIVVDTAPTLSMFDASVYLSADAFVMVTECEKLSVDGLRDGMAYIEQFAQMRRQYGTGPVAGIIGIVPNKLRHGTANHRANARIIGEKYGSLLWPSLYLRTDHSEAQNFGQSVFSYRPTGAAAVEAAAMCKRAEAVLNV